MEFEITERKRGYWSDGALNCYNRNCICSKDCDNNFICKQWTQRGLMPRMKVDVIALVRKFGKPRNALPKELFLEQ